MQFFILTTLLILVFNPTFSYGSKLSYEGKNKLPINDCVPISNTLVGDFRNGDRVTFSDDNCATFLKKGRTSITSCSPTIEFKKPGGWPETILTPSEPGVYQLCFYNDDKISILLEVELETEEYLAFLQERGVSITTGMDYTTGIDMTTTTTTGVASTTTTTDVSTTAVSTTAVTTTAATTGATVSTTGVPTTDASTTAATTGATVSTTGVPTITTTGATTTSTSTTTTSSTTSTSTSTTTSSSTTSDVTTSTSTTSTTGDATTSTSTTGTTTTTTGSTSTTGSTTGTTNTTIVVVVDTSAPQNVTIPGLSTPITIALPGIANGTASFSAAGPDVSGYVDPSANLPSGGTFLSASFFITIKVDGWPVESFEDNPIMVTLTNPGQTADDDLWLFDVIDNTWVLVTSTCTGGQKSVRIGDQITVPICHLTQFALFRTPALSANTDGGGVVINPVKSSGISSGAIAAAVIVPVLVVLVVLVLVIFLIRKRQSKTKNDDIELASPYARKNTNANEQSMSKITIESLTSDAKQKPVISHTKEESSDEESESETSESESSSDSSDSTSESSSSATSESESDQVEPVKPVIATPKVTPTPPAKTSPVVNRKSVQPEPTVVATAQELITKGPGAKPVTQATLTGASKPKEESSEESESETDESEVEQVRPVAAHEESSEEESSDSESSSSETSSSSESN